MPFESFLILFFALIGLWLGTRIVINNSILVAHHFGLSEFFIGLTILSIGTDLPEMVVSITGAIHKLNGEETSGLIVGNAIGSSLGQMGFALGISGLFYHITVDKTNGLRDGIMMAISTFVLMVLASDGYISRIEGALLVVIFVVYMTLLFKQEKSLSVETKVLAKEKLSKKQFFLLGIKLLVGMAVLIYSSERTIEGALDIANHFQIRPSIIGIFIIGLGTSLPEIAVSIGGIMNKSAGLTGGTIIGSTIFDILVPIGISSSISTLSFDNRIADFDIPFLAIIGLIAFTFLITRNGISKIEASLILLIFFIYSWLKLTS